jgi:hypothetical protein
MLTQGLEGYDTVDGREGWIQHRVVVSGDQARYADGCVHRHSSQSTEHAYVSVGGTRVCECFGIFTHVASSSHSHKLHIHTRTGKRPPALP